MHVPAIAPSSGILRPSPGPASPFSGTSTPSACNAGMSHLRVLVFCMSEDYPPFSVEIRQEHQQTGVNPVSVSETGECPQCVAEIPRQARDDGER